MSSNKMVEYHLVGSAEANPAEMRISNESPVGKAIMGHKKGDVVEARDPQRAAEVQDHGDQGRVDSRGMSLPKHFRDRDAIAAVRAEAEPLDAGATAERPSAASRAASWRGGTWGSSSSSTSSTARGGSS